MVREKYIWKHSKIDCEITQQFKLPLFKSKEKLVGNRWTDIKWCNKMSEWFITFLFLEGPKSLPTDKQLHQYTSTGVVACCPCMGET